MTTTASVNDINHCVAQAHRLAQHIHQPQRKEHSLARAFTSLAGDETTGLLAFAIWRGRSQLYKQQNLGTL
jgi:hypothetical protein